MKVGTRHLFSYLWTNPKTVTIVLYQKRKLDQDDLQFSSLKCSTNSQITKNDCLGPNSSPFSKKKNRTKATKKSLKYHVLETGKQQLKGAAFVFFVKFITGWSMTVSLKPCRLHFPFISYVLILPMQKQALNLKCGVQKKLTNASGLDFVFEAKVHICSTQFKNKQRELLRGVHMLSLYSHTISKVDQSKFDWSKRTQFVFC